MSEIKLYIFRFVLVVYPFSASSFTHRSAGGYDNFHAPNEKDFRKRRSKHPGLTLGARTIFAVRACPGERGSGPSWARTSHRPYYAPLNPLAKLVHSRGDGLSSPCDPCKNLTRALFLIH